MTGRIGRRCWDVALPRLPCYRRHLVHIRLERLRRCTLVTVGVLSRRCRKRKSKSFIYSCSYLCSFSNYEARVSVLMIYAYDQYAFVLLSILWASVRGVRKPGRDRHLQVTSTPNPPSPALPIYIKAIARFSCRS